MFGMNPVMGKDHGDGKTLRVVRGSPFYTIQGEGPYSGHPATFIRLWGCNLRCTFCDTEFSDPADPMQEIDWLVRECNGLGARLVVITGGEPFRQNILPLVEQLRWSGHNVQIETAGTLWIPGIERLADIIVSPKTPRIHPEIAHHAMAFKYVVSEERDTFTHNGIPITSTQPNTKPAPLASPPSDNPCPIYYSPMDELHEEENEKNRVLAAALALNFRRRVTLQVHKILGLD